MQISIPQNNEHRCVNSKWPSADKWTNSKRAGVDPQVCALILGVHLGAPTQIPPYSNGSTSLGAPRKTPEVVADFVRRELGAADGFINRARTLPRNCVSNVR